MRAVVQRVNRGGVTVEDKVIGQIGLGFVVLLGVGREDREEDAAYLADKIVNLRVFEDETGKLNRSLLDVGGAVLAVSQFTLYADCRKGRRPGFSDAAPPETALVLYEQFVHELRERGIRVETGQFQAHMVVSLENDGPVTLLIDSKKTF